MEVSTRNPGCLTLSSRCASVHCLASRACVSRGSTIGFLTSFLNPKGLLVYFAILPNFMTPNDGLAHQALLLSAVFIGLCALVYGIVGIVVSAVGRIRLTRDIAGSPKGLREAC
jgi:threonine/homoserine/homoserine lactone efflux protein